MFKAVSRPSALALLALFTLISACATERGAGPTGPVVKDITIDGTKKVKEGDIKAKILTTETPWYAELLPFMFDKQYFDANAWQADLRRIERYYQAQGYYQAEVLSDEIVPKGKNAVAIRVKVREGDPTLVDKVEIHGLEDLPKDQQKTALDELPLKSGEIFHEDDWTGLKAQIQLRLKELGYAEAAVTGQVTVDTATHRADVSLLIVPGKRFKFGKIFVATDPHPKVPGKRIIEQAQGAIKPDAWYSESALAEAQARVFKMGVFGAVKVNRGAPDRDAATVPVVVDVREAPFHTERVGVGVDVDLASRNEAHVSGEYTDRNFFGGLRRLTAQGRAGYAILAASGGLFGGGDFKEGPVGNLTLELEQPRFIQRDLRLQTSATVESTLEQAFSSFGARGKLGLVWQPHPDFSIYPSYNVEADRIFGFPLSATAAGTGQSPALALGCKSTPCNVVLQYTEQVIEWDRRNDRNEPKRGFYAALSLQEGFTLLGFGDFPYLRLQPEGRYYHSFLDDKLTISAKLKVGDLIPFSGNRLDSPVTTRFYSGGANAMRGFNTRRLSPLQTSDRPADKYPSPLVTPVGIGIADGVAIGGNSLVESSLEVRYNIHGNLVLAAFMDAGFVSLDFWPMPATPPAADGISDGAAGGSLGDKLLYAGGVGIRYNTVVGPIRLDLAARLPQGPPLEVVQSTPGRLLRVPSNGGCFGIGASKPNTYDRYAGAPEGLCAIHISVGEAF